MKSIFLCEDKSCVSRVYTKSIAETLEREAELSTVIYNKAEILSSPETFKTVEYIFSTWNMPAFTKEEVNAYLPSLKCIFYAAGTVKFFARGFLDAGVRVFSARTANAIPVAETAAAQIVLANKGFFQTSRVYKQKQYATSRAVLEKCAGNYDTNVGIIGAGAIGKQVIRLLHNYRLNIFVYDPFLPDEEAANLYVKKCDLQTLFSTCVTVSNHLADNPQTKGMLTGDLFLSMPPFATFINTGRGAQVAERELIDALKKRPDLTAVLDVTDPEPVPTDNELYKLDNCILTPHIAGSQNNEVHRMSEYMLEEFWRYIRGENCLFEITREMLGTMA
ncbi:MAG: hydroxyacid dehydrogenase [Candidatus Borkfalkiaceae bacterium]|nr:hydroxyacid dehydrogenase [Clostridia bacterium]MDY6222766.1 hydroxyacid dehydrogenase [Christensenellaceae bacterium]